MTRCEACDLELDDVERFCPGCGTPAPRRVVDVATALRESFLTAADDDSDEIEYAFGGSTRSKGKPTKPAQRSKPAARASAPPKPAPPPPADPEPPSVVDEVVSVPVEVDEPEIAAADEDVLVDAEMVGADDDAEDEQQGAADLVQPDDAEALLPAQDVEPSAEDHEEDTALAAEIPAAPGASEALAAEAQAGHEPERTDDTGADDAGAEEEPDVAATPEPPARRRRPRTAINAPVTEFKPYVVLPARRAAAVVERPVEIEPPAADGADRPNRRSGRRIAVLLTLILIAGGAIAYVLMLQSPEVTSTPFTAESADHAISLDAPAGWRLQSRSKGVVAIEEPRRDLHVQATAIRRSALAKGLSLRGRAKQVHGELLDSFDQVGSSPAKETKIGPYPALRTVIAAKSSGVEVTYIHDVVKTPKYFVNVLAWAPAEGFEAQQAELLRVLASLQAS